MRKQYAYCAMISAMFACLVSHVSANSFLLDGSLGMTWGDFTVKDVTADISNDFGNPSLMAEFRFGENEHFAIGLGYGQTKNDFTGEWDGSEERHTEGEVTVDRKNLDLFFRFIPSKHFNIRLGYRNFRYEFSDGYLEKWQYGDLIETAEDAKASGDLTSGFLAELNFCTGDDFQFRFALGFSYFTDAKYDWEYARTVYNPTATDYNEGSATQNAIAVSLKPEFTFRLMENLRATVDFTLSGAIWDGDTDQADIEDYQGVDIYSAFGFGFEYFIPFGAGPRAEKSAD